MKLTAFIAKFLFLLQHVNNDNTIIGRVECFVASYKTSKRLDLLHNNNKKRNQWMLFTSYQQRRTLTCIQQQQQHQEVEQTKVATIPSQQTQKIQIQQQFETEKQQVYIEDTDAYGVLYNSNYLKFYDRALQLHLRTSTSTTDTNTITKHQRQEMMIVSIDEMKFKSSPLLGGSFCIVGTQRVIENQPKDKVQENLDANDQMVWDLKMVNNNNKNAAVAYNIASGVRFRSLYGNHNYNDSTQSFNNNDTQNSIDNRTKKTLSSSRIDIFPCYRDELDFMILNNNNNNNPNPTTMLVLPLRNVLNFFERSRSNALGGPSTLYTFQKVHGIVFVVTTIQQLRFTGSNYDGSIVSMDADQNVMVETNFCIKKRGMIIECDHKLRIIPKEQPNSLQNSDNQSNNSHTNNSTCTNGIDSLPPIYAQGLVTIMALNDTTRRPTSDVPLAVLESILNP